MRESTASPPSDHPFDEAGRTEAPHARAPGAAISLRQRVATPFWRAIGQPLFRLTFHNWDGPRRHLLRLFGADVHRTARIRPTARISHPWNLSIGAHTAVGDHAILFCPAPIRIGRRCTISQYAFLCAGDRDDPRRSAPAGPRSIDISDDVWVAADVFVGAGVTVGQDTVIGARSTALRSLPPRSICAGDDARRIGPRIIRYPAPVGAASPEPPSSHTGRRYDADSS